MHPKVTKKTLQELFPNSKEIFTNRIEVLQLKYTYISKLQPNSTSEHDSTICFKLLGLFSYEILHVNHVCDFKDHLEDLFSTVEW